MFFRASKTPLIILGHSRFPFRSRCFSPVLGRTRIGSFPSPKQVPFPDRAPLQRVKSPLCPHKNVRTPVTSVSVANSPWSSRLTTFVEPAFQPPVVPSIPRTLIEPTVPVRRESVGEGTRKTYKTGVRRWHKFVAFIGTNPILSRVPPEWDLINSTPGTIPRPWREDCVTNFLTWLRCDPNPVVPKSAFNYLSAVRFFFINSVWKWIS